MKNRKVAVVVASFLLVGALFYVWTRYPVPSVLEEGKDRQVVSSPSEPEAPVVAVSSEENEPEEPSPVQKPSEAVSRNAVGEPIPFERLAMSELEEIDLTNTDEPHSHKIREWRGQLEPNLREIKNQLDIEGEDGVLAISLPDATQVEVTRLRYQAFGPNQGVISGKILGDPFGEVVLSYVNQAVAGSIRDYRNDQVWEIRNAGGGRQFIAQVDVDALGECGVCAVHGEAN